MNNRTIIGGRAYETVGSSSSSLLLLCNGTARVKFGNKLIDLVKNGKIATGESSEQIFIISDKSEIKSDGIYVLITDDTTELWIKKDGKQYNFTEADLYISASQQQKLTVDQQKQALENIGLYYNTLAEVEAAGIQNGLVYVIADNMLYTIKNGAIAEFEAKVKTVTVETTTENGDGAINSSDQIVLSIANDDYLILKDKKIIANCDVCIKNFAQLTSEDADVNRGYRLYVKGEQSYLDIDNINVRNGLPDNHVEITYNALRNKISQKTLHPNTWYLITDFQNHWKLPINDNRFNRPILVQALTDSTLCKEGKLFSDPRVVLHYDYTYYETILQEESIIRTRGRITWMKDAYNNEANFDFLDYFSATRESLTTLHYDGVNQSIFPLNSYNNKLIAHNLKGTVLKDSVLDDTETSNIKFECGEMYNNYIVCEGISVKTNKFFNNTINKCYNVNILEDFANNTFNLIKTSEEEIIIPTTFNVIIYNVSVNNFINSSFNGSIYDSTFQNITNCNINGIIHEVKFKNLNNCTFSINNLRYIECYSDIQDYAFDIVFDPLLYNTSEYKKIFTYEENSSIKLNIIFPKDQYFQRGMIMMHSGITPIPLGWAICDGQEYEWNGIISTTPNLIDRFIKAVDSIDKIGAVDNTDLTSDNEFTLQSKHLPEHTHPHNEHTHVLNNIIPDFAKVQSLENGIDVINTLQSNAEVSPTTSEELDQTWENTSFKIEPNYYSLIFIMKL